MSTERRIKCNSSFARGDALHELDALAFAFAAMADRFPLGSFDREMAQNALVGVRRRIDYLHDSLVHLLAAPSTRADNQTKD